MESKHQQEVRFMHGLVVEFSNFVAESMRDGIHTDFDDHHDFLKAALYTFLDIVENKEADDTQETQETENGCYE